MFWVESIIEKLSALTGTSCTCSQCSLIAEWGGAVKGRPVRQEMPLCSAVLVLSVIKHFLDRRNSTTTVSDEATEHIKYISLPYFCSNCNKLSF